jgi:hypothetical protein
MEESQEGNYKYYDLVFNKSKIFILDTFSIVTVEKLFNKLRKVPIDLGYNISKFSII